MKLVVWADISYAYVTDVLEDRYVIAIYAVVDRTEHGLPMFWSAESGDAADAVTNVADAEPDMVIEFYPNSCADINVPGMPHLHGKNDARNLAAAMMRAFDVAADFYTAESWAP